MSGNVLGGFRPEQDDQHAKAMPSEEEIYRQAAEIRAGWNRKRKRLQRLSEQVPVVYLPTPVLIAKGGVRES